MENVSGMVKGAMKLIFAEILTELKASGYRVSARLLNAKFFNVPQSRERMIFIGVRNDLGIEPSHPIGNSKVITVKEALKDCIVSETPEFNDRYAQLWERVPVGGNAQDVIGTGFNSCNKLHPNKCSRTLPKMQTGRGFATVCHWLEPRAISISEAKRLHSYPDEYDFAGAYSESWARIGNSVPPNFMRAIAEHIRDNILNINKEVTA
jgi:DNA (cytosine-5)-methyltransferase 1